MRLLTETEVGSDDHEEAALAGHRRADHLVPDELEPVRRRRWLVEAEITLSDRGHEITPAIRADLAYYYDAERPQEWKQPENDERELEERSDRELAALLDRLRSTRAHRAVQPSPLGLEA